MKHIYVYKQLIGGWKAISEEEVKTMIENGRVFGVEMEMEMDRGENDDGIKITLLKDHFGIFGVTDSEMEQLMTDYFTYVEEITGMVTCST